MLRPRVIPALLLSDEGLVKTVAFSQPKYVGDPMNAVRIFNEKEADELLVLDIDATRQGAGPNYRLISKLAAECRMPLCYGGGVTTVEQFEKIISLGVEKVAVSAAAVNDPDLVRQASLRVGSQSVVAVVDVKKTGLMGRYEVVTHNASVRTGLKPIAWAQELQERGAGEIVVNCVDRDGVMNGYDLELAGALRAKLKVPMTVLGGAGSFDDVSKLVRQNPLTGAAAGSIFVFKGKLRAVLISYPNRATRNTLVNAE